MEETIWEELDRFIGSIGDEIRSEEPSVVSIDFWLFKIKRRVDMLKTQSYLQPIQKRSIIQRLIRIPGMWNKQWSSFENVPRKDVIVFMFRSAWIVLKNQ